MTASATLDERADRQDREDRVGWWSLRHLAAAEASILLRRASLWIGWALTVYFAWQTQRGVDRWPGERYEALLPASFGPMLIGVFVAMVRTGGRDRVDGMLAPAAVLDDVDRAAARLLALVVPVVLAVVTTIAVWIGTLVEGGYSLGEGIRSTTTARHGVLELAQPTLLVALVGAVGVAVGRSRRWIAGSVVTVFVLFLTVVAWWVAQGPVLSIVSPVQTMPLRVALDAGVSAADTPPDWFVYYDDDERQLGWQYVHVATQAGHTIYLLGLVGLAGAALARDRRATMRTIAALVALLGVTIQLFVSPYW